MSSIPSSVVIRGAFGRARFTAVRSARRDRVVVQFIGKDARFVHGNFLVLTSLQASKMQSALQYMESRRYFEGAKLKLTFADLANAI